MMVGKRADMRPIYTSTITINNFYKIVKVIVDYLFRPTSTSFTITPNISSLKFMYNEQSTMFTWVMGGRVAGMEHISNSPITTNSFSCILKGKVYDIFRPSYTSTISALIFNLDSPSSQLLYLVPLSSSELILPLSFS